MLAGRRRPTGTPTTRARTTATPPDAARRRRRPLGAAPHRPRLRRAGRRLDRLLRPARARPRRRARGRGRLRPGRGRPRRAASPPRRCAALLGADRPRPAYASGRACCPTTPPASGCSPSAASPSCAARNEDGELVMARPLPAGRARGDPAAAGRHRPRRHAGPLRRHQSPTAPATCSSRSSASGVAGRLRDRPPAALGRGGLRARRRARPRGRLATARWSGTSRGPGRTSSDRSTPRPGSRSAGCCARRVPGSAFAVETLAGIGLEPEFLERHPVARRARRAPLEELFDGPARQAAGPARGAGAAGVLGRGRGGGRRPA